jgi:hypothetical protein
VSGAPVKLCTGFMVIGADDESFTFHPSRSILHVHHPEGHTMSAWISLLAHRDGDVTVAQAQAQALALERPSDPFDELACVLGGNIRNSATIRTARQTLGAALRKLTGRR